MLQSVNTKVWVKNLKDQDQETAHIARLDPLGLDPCLVRLPELNKQGDVRGVIRDLYSHLPYPDTLNQFSYAECIACMRDIGIYLGSIKKHHLEPVEEIPELDYVLDVLSTKTDMPPRDTLSHYTVWNPSGSRIRTYTGLKAEVALIQSVRIAMTPLIWAIYALKDLYTLPLAHEEFPTSCDLIREKFNAVIEGIVMAKKNVPPSVFAEELRLYYDPIVIYNKDFIGPGAVEMPLFVYDYILWGADVKNLQYQEFSRTYLPFNLPAIRDIYYNFIDQPSLLSKAVEEIEDNPDDPNVLNAAKSLLKLCKAEKSFRMPHKKLAEDAYKHQHETEREVGSGGYSTGILADILHENITQIDKLEHAIKRANDD